jgi:hypothetical protein
MSGPYFEKLIYEGEEKSIIFGYILPLNEPRIKKVYCDHAYTGSWQGYNGIWEINNNILYLVHIEGRYSLKSDTPLFAYWINDTIVVPKGRRIATHSYMPPDYEIELHLTIKNGIVVKTKTVDNRDKYLYMALIITNLNDRLPSVTVDWDDAGEKLIKFVDYSHVKHSSIMFWEWLRWQFDASGDTILEKIIESDQGIDDALMSLKKTKTFGDVV